ncbi:MAG: PEGA domain-containing protein [Deltaproteobacteria bacterium]|nr:PEGA domain-containing protein [Deltaproteobacteria bacterium]
MRLPPPVLPVALLLSAALPVAAQERIAVPLRAVVYLESEKARGAGVVISSDGLVLTSTRSILKGRQITVTLYVGPGEEPRALPANVVVRDDWFTLLQIDGEGFRPATLGVTAGLRMDDRVVALDETSKAFSLAVTTLGPVEPMNPRAGGLQPALKLAVPWNGLNAGGPVFNTAGDVVGFAQGPVEGNFAGTRALRVEDARDFLLRNKAQLPPRQLTVTGLPGMTAGGELVPETSLPLTLSFRPHDIFTLRVRQDGSTCGVLRPDTARYEPVQAMGLGTAIPLGTLSVVELPPQATVTIETLEVGRGPMTLACMGQGQYAVLVAAPGFQPLRESVTIRAGETTTLRAPLRELKGMLGIATRPVGGEVWVDGKLLGITPVAELGLAPGAHVLSVRFPGGARVRRAIVIEDRRKLDVGTVDLPPPGALLSLEHDNVNVVYLDGRGHGTLRGHVVITPGTHVVQARDEMGNVLTDTWDAPPGGFREVRFNGGSSTAAPVLHGVGVLSGVVGLAGVVLGVAVAAGIPLGTVGLMWGLGGLNDLRHRGTWAPALALGLVGAAPCLAVGCTGLLGALALAPPWERLLAQGSVAPPGRPEEPIPFTPTPGWELRGVAQGTDGPRTPDVVPTTDPGGPAQDPLGASP